MLFLSWYHYVASLDVNFDSCLSLFTLIPKSIFQLTKEKGYLWLARSTPHNPPVFKTTSVQTELVKSLDNHQNVYTAYLIRILQI